MEQGQHRFAIEMAREAADEDSAVGGELRLGVVQLLQELVHAALFLLHPVARGGALEQVLRWSPVWRRLRTASLPVYGSEVKRRRVGAQVEVAAGQQERVGEHDVVIHAVDRDHRRGAMLPALPDETDALRADRARG